MASCSRAMSRLISPTWCPTDFIESFKRFTLSIRLEPWFGWNSLPISSLVFFRWIAAIVPGIDAIAVIRAAIPAKSCHHIRALAGRVIFPLYLVLVCVLARWLFLGLMLLGLARGARFVGLVSRRRLRGGLGRLVPRRASLLCWGLAMIGVLLSVFPSSLSFQASVYDCLHGCVVSPQGAFPCFSVSVFTRDYVGC